MIKFAFGFMITCTELKVQLNNGCFWDIKFHIVSNPLTGPSIYKKGLDWKHGEPHPSVQGCDWEVSARECCFIYLYGNETTHNLTSQWSLPTNNNIRYAVDLVIRTTNEASSYYLIKYFLWNVSFYINVLNMITAGGFVLGGSDQRWLWSGTSSWVTQGTPKKLWELLSDFFKAAQHKVVWLSEFPFRLNRYLINENVMLISAKKIQIGIDDNICLYFEYIISMLDAP